MSMDASTGWLDLSDGELIVAYEAAVRDYRKIREPLLKAFIRKGEDPKQNIHVADTIRLLTTDQRRRMVTLGIQLAKSGIVYNGGTGEWSKVTGGRLEHRGTTGGVRRLSPGADSVP